MPQEIIVNDRRHLDAPIITDEPPRMIIVHDKRESRDGEKTDYRQWEVPAEVLLQERRAASGYADHEMALIDRMLDVELEATADDRHADALLWSDVGSAVTAELWDALRAARTARDEAKRKARTAYESLAVHRDRRPRTEDEIDQWATTLSQLERSHGAREEFAAQAQAEYVIVATRLLSAVREVVQDRWRGTQAQAEPTRETVAHLRAQADQIERDYQLRTAAIGRLLGALTAQGINIFEEVT
jgi:hypothetical protein